MEVIELTDQIKEFILANRVYHPPKQTPQQIINQTINYNNTMNNFIANMDTAEKIHKLLHHQQCKLLDFDKHVERTFQPRIEELKDAHVEHVELEHDDIVDLVDLVTKINKKVFEDSKSLDAFNVIYDNDIKRLKIYSKGEWSDFITTRGIKRIVDTIKDHYLDRYECYLIRKINNANEVYRARQRARELLEDYYKFLSVFDSIPYVQNHRDRDVLYDKYDDRFYRASDRKDLCEQYMDKYRKISEVITRQEATKVQKMVCEIVRHNSKKNIDELNKQVLTMLNADDHFKASVIPMHVLNG